MGKNLPPLYYDDRPPAAKRSQGGPGTAWIWDIPCAFGYNEKSGGRSQPITTRVC
ncbi:MAG: hypothetical protein KatS3mg110_4476 [Pirellulaceae bacterium]|nr:MAG: hypothetical protein KatS3mg110_4476 [Pirellulaceae bacterium]